MSENRVKAEKASLISVAMIAITSGITLIGKDQIVTGLILVAVGVLLIVLREHLKFHRWKRMIGSNSRWRGKDQ